MKTLSKKIEIDQELFKTISKLAKKGNNMEDEIINDILRKEFKKDE
ncbi:MAG: hypothetical protein FWH29_02885 [Methanobrevibacter sp.]|nr:hypothetical protein [Methanobrevibacter sp.]